MSKDELSKGSIPVVGARGNYPQHLYSCGKLILTVTFWLHSDVQSLTLVCFPCCKVADAGGVVSQKQRFAIFGTRVPACATPCPFVHFILQVETKYVY
jgi:hypothetical protein